MCFQKTFDVYIAIPYTHKSKYIREQRYRKANSYLARLTKQGLCAFSPITHSHPVSEYGVSTKWEDWKDIDFRILDNSQVIHVITDKGWQDSTGVTAEIEHAKKRKIPVIFIDPHTFEGEYSV